MRDWKPGDVAMVTNRYTATNIAICSVDRDLDLAWRFGCTDATEPVGAPARPLVVIDPEDREQVERLAGSIGYHGDADLFADRLHAALREFANPTPPKPDEPTGLGAVVEESDGAVWVRTDTSTSNRWVRAGFGTRARWDGINAVRVLSEGVTQ